MLIVMVVAMQSLVGFLDGRTMRAAASSALLMLVITISVHDASRRKH